MVDSSDLTPDANYRAAPHVTDPRPRVMVAVYDIGLCERLLSASEDVRMVRASRHGASHMICSLIADT
jgi:hypothetical protein